MHSFTYIYIYICIYTVCIHHIYVLNVYTIYIYIYMYIPYMAYMAYIHHTWYICIYVVYNMVSTPHIPYMVAGCYMQLETLQPATVRARSLLWTITFHWRKYHVYTIYIYIYIKIYWYTCAHHVYGIGYLLQSRRSRNNKHTSERI